MGINKSAWHSAQHRIWPRCVTSVSIVRATDHLRKWFEKWSAVITNKADPSAKKWKTQAFRTDELCSAWWCKCSHLIKKFGSATCSRSQRFDFKARRKNGPLIEGWRVAARNQSKQRNVAMPRCHHLLWSERPIKFSNQSTLGHLNILVVRSTIKNRSVEYDEILSTGDLNAKRNCQTTFLFTQ